MFVRAGLIWPEGSAACLSNNGLSAHSTGEDECSVQRHRFYDLEMFTLFFFNNCSHFGQAVGYMVTNKTI